MSAEKHREVNPKLSKKSFVEILVRAEDEILALFSELAGEERWSSLEAAMQPLWLLRWARREIEPPALRDPENRSDKDNPPATGGGGWRGKPEEIDRLRLLAIVQRAEMSFLRLLKQAADENRWDLLDGAFTGLPALEQARLNLELRLVPALPGSSSPWAAQQNRSDKVNPPATGGGSSVSGEPPGIPTALLSLRQAEGSILDLLIVALEAREWTTVSALFPALRNSHQARLSLPPRLTV